RWVVALLGDQVVPFAYGGLRSGRESRGLRPLGSKPIALASADAYLAAMAAAKIEIDPAKRRGAILRQARKLAKAAGGVIADLDVLDEVVNLVERPTALLGAFAPESLELPREALVAVMKKHQRYFPVQTKDGKLLPHFIAVRNGDTRHLDLVRDGNEQVIRARFADAAFFLREDRKLKLEDFLPRLSKLTFQAKLGSMLDKAGRIELLAAVVADRLALSDADRVTALRAARLAKADLGSQMVVEMTSLQGIMGYEYALASGETPEVALAIREQYGLPESKPGIVVALADRLDSLTGLFAAGLAPTGSADPFGLRRAALGVNQILTQHALTFDLRGAVQAAADLLPATAPASAAVVADVLAFLTGRLR
ncbi:MAG TPA: glycine--tRNA ligase subunit beta, partial [Anaerolineales bacterium]|nr:glycine--tRNA ligase subunit beta [Anaerolineales bacterium]